MKRNQIATMIAASTLYIAQAAAVEGISEILDGSSSKIILEKWDDHKMAWQKITFSDKINTLQLYHNPSKVNVSGAPSNLFSAFSESLSPDKKFLIIQRSEIGNLYLEDGSTRDTETSKCEIIDMKNGCVMQTRPAEYCSGKWSPSNKWTTSVDNTPRAPVLETPSPALLNKRITGMSSTDKLTAIQDSLYMGSASYLACFPPSHSNIRDLDDIAYFLAESGDNQQALEIYKALEVAAPNRIVLKLNIADSLWSENRKSEAKIYYSKYVENMKKLDKAKRIPPRAIERMAN